MCKPLTLHFLLRAAQMASGWCCFFLMLTPPVPQLHCPLLCCPMLPSLSHAPDPTPIWTRASENPFIVMGGKQCPPAFSLPSPTHSTPPAFLMPSSTHPAPSHLPYALSHSLHLPPSRNYMGKSSELLILHTWCYPTGTNVEPGGRSHARLPDGLGDICHGE